jgi:hypothetical protein
VGSQDPGLQRGDELVDQARLAHASRAEHGDQVAGPLGVHSLVPLREHVQLELAADHGSGRPRGSERALGEDLEEPPHGLLSLEPVEGQRLGRLGLDHVRHQLVRLVAEQDLSGARGLLQPLGQVDRLAGELLVQRGGVAYQHIAGVDAQPDDEVESAFPAELLGQSGEGRPELADGQHGAQGVVLAQPVGAEGGHEAVTLPLADTGPVAAEGLADDLVEAVQELLHGLPVELALQLGGVDHLAEDDRDDPELLGRRPGG